MKFIFLRMFAVLAVIMLISACGNIIYDDCSDCNDKQTDYYCFGFMSEIEEMRDGDFPTILYLHALMYMDQKYGSSADMNKCPAFADVDVCQALADMDERQAFLRGAAAFNKLCIGKNDACKKIADKCLDVFQIKE